MTHTPDTSPVGPERKLDVSHRLVTVAIIGAIFIIAILLLFVTSLLSGVTGSAAGNSTGEGVAVGETAPVPAATEMPVAEIVTKSATCQVTGILSITGTVESNVNHPLSLQITGNGYDTNGDLLGTGFDSVQLDPQDTSSFSVNVADGCQIGEIGSYEVRISNIAWRQTG